MFYGSFCFVLFFTDLHSYLAGGYIIHSWLSDTSLKKTLQCWFLQSQKIYSSKFSKNDRMMFLSLRLLKLSIQASFLEGTAQQVVFIVVSQKKTFKQSTLSQISGCFPLVINMNRAIQQEEQYSDKNLHSLQSSYPKTNPKTIMERTWQIVFELFQQQKNRLILKMEQRQECSWEIPDKDIPAHEQYTYNPKPVFVKQIPNKHQNIKLKSAKKIVDKGFIKKQMQQGVKSQLKLTQHFLLAIQLDFLIFPSCCCNQPLSQQKRHFLHHTDHVFKVRKENKESSLSCFMKRPSNIENICCVIPKNLSASRRGHFYWKLLYCV